MPEPSGRVALVTGAGRGVGRGIARALGGAGWTVYVTGRGPAGAAPLAETALMISDAGGAGVAVQCDHRDAAQIRALVEQVHAEQSRIDLLVNNVWAMPPDLRIFQDRFWERPADDWDSLIGVGLQAHYVAAVHSAKVMVSQGYGLIANISSWGARGATAERKLHSVLYGVSKTALDKMAYDMAHDLSGTGVSTVSLWLGLMRTERLVERGVQSVDGLSMATAETPEYVGRILDALVRDPELSRRSGHTFVTAELGADYGITEDDGSTPPTFRDTFGGGPIF